MRIVWIKTIDGLGNAGTKQYDGVGNVLVSTDREGNATQYTYDKNYNLLKTTDAEGGVSSSAYDALGRVVSATDENGNATTYTYDKNGNVLTETDALSRCCYQHLRHTRQSSSNYGQAGCNDYLHL